MNRCKQLFGRILPLVLVLALLAGCGSPQGEETGAAGGAGDPTTITFWGWIPFNSEMEKIVQAFNQKHPDIKVDYQIMDWNNYWNKLTLDLNTGAGPDVFAMNYGYYAKFKDNMTELTPLADTVIGADWKTKYKQDLLEGAYRDGELRMMPAAFGGQWYIYYNKTLMQEMGFNVPKTYEEWSSFSKLAGSTAIPILFGGKESLNNAYLYHWLVNSIQPGIVQDAAKGKTKFTDEPFVKAFAALQKMYADGLIKESSFGIAANPDADNLFKNRKGAAFLSGFWLTGPLLAGQQLAGTAIEKDELGVALMPNPLGKETIVGEIDHGWVINENSEHKEAAMKFVSELTTGESAKIWLSALFAQPVAADIAMDYGAIKTEEAKNTVGVIEDSVKNLVGPRSSGIPEIDNKTGDVIMAVLLGSMTVDEALKQIQAAYDKLPKS
ncbi:ABC transporter substrate-binding protein [Paenibacillus xerothermodurans]|uniref:Sugar ABC transporter substrate-binding protein n=1 Tax=Paenibacillus xerothermodurans TaxID=1977292 RepID=A0A2W1N5Q2_PAEXE|nr:sugar ABC transporter substrate-binding protein [Paenibacillus xerothermodurans]PZE20029.1 sugar ABC transporter substrate-binding protein [Paenibacillus xerothermodurans]